MSTANRPSARPSIAANPVAAAAEPQSPTKMKARTWQRITRNQIVVPSFNTGSSEEL